MVDEIMQSWEMF